MSNTTSNSSIIVFAIFALLADAKPLNHNQVKFRRIPPKEFSAALGSSITIECEAGASPQPTIHWLKNGKRIQQFDADENQLDDGQSVNGRVVDDINRIGLSATRARLFIDCASFDDEAIYTCVAENEFSRVSSHTKLNLIKPPAIQSAANQQQQAADETNDLLDNTAASNHQQQSSKLINGGGNNGAGRGSSQALAEELEMIAAGRQQQQQQESLAAIPQCLSQRGQAQATEPVRIQMWTHNIVEVMKNDVILYCRSNAKKSLPANPATEPNGVESIVMSSQTTSTANSNAALLMDKRPIATVTWTLPDDKLVGLEQKDKYEILDTGDLLIKDLRWADMGSYVCTVADEQGSDSVSSFVYPASAKATMPWKHWLGKGS